MKTPAQWLTELAAAGWNARRDGTQEPILADQIAAIQADARKAALEEAAQMLRAFAKDTPFAGGVLAEASARVRALKPEDTEKQDNG